MASKAEGPPVLDAITTAFGRKCFKFFFGNNVEDELVECTFVDEWTKGFEGFVPDFKN